jgi:hypothetical protein
VNKFAENLLTVIDAAISPPQSSEQRERSFLRAIGQEAKHKPDAASVSTMATEQKSYKGSQGFVNKHTAEHAREAFVGQHARHTAVAAGGEAVGEHAFTREQIETSFELKRESGKSAMRASSLRAALVAKELAAAFTAPVGKLADGIEADEKALCAKFGFPHSPSALVLAIRSAIKRVEQAANPDLSYGYCEPARMVPFLDL